MRTWRDAVKNVIAEQCAEAYRIANTTSDGRHRRRHVPYHVPPLAKAMVDALNRDDEHECKRLMLLYRTGAVSLI